MSDTQIQREASPGDVAEPVQKAESGDYETMRGCLGLLALIVIGAIASVAAIVVFGSHVR